ncbi:unnamed protein product [Mortierella alpina]
MRSSSPEPLTAAYHDQHSARQAPANPQEFAVIDGVSPNPTSLSPHTTPGRAPQLVSSPLQHPQSIPLEEFSSKNSPQLLSSGSPQGLPPAYAPAHHEEPYWSALPPASPSHASPHLSQPQDPYQQYQHLPYPLPNEQPPSMWTQSGVSHPEDFLQHQQSINHSPGITASASDAVLKPVYITSSPGRRKRKVLWTICLFLVMLAIVLGVVFGWFLKDNKNDQSGGDLEDRSRSRTTSALTFTSTRTVQPTPSGLGPSEGLTTTVTTQPATYTQPPTPNPPTDPGACMKSCSTKFYDCLDVCDGAQRECQAPCGDDLVCRNPCGFKNGDCRQLCFSAQRRCQC